MDTGTHTHTYIYIHTGHGSAGMRLVLRSFEALHTHTHTHTRIHVYKHTGGANMRRQCARTHSHKHTQKYTTRFSFLYEGIAVFVTQRENIEFGRDCMNFGFATTVIRQHKGHNDDHQRTSAKQYNIHNI